MKRAISITRFLGILTSFSILIPWYFEILRNFRPAGEDWLNLFAPLLFPVWFPGFMYFFRLAKEPTDNDAIPKLAKCFGTSLFVFVCSLTLTIASWSDDWKTRLVFGTPGLLAAGWSIASLKSFFEVKRQGGKTHDFGIRATLTALAFTGWSLLMVAVLAQFGDRRDHSEASSVGSLRTIRAAQEAFATNHRGRGFAKSLDQLGPPPGDDLIDSTLASGTKSGYAFAISVSPDDRGVVTKYQVRSRPLKYGKYRNHSFLMDESGQIHWTTEPRDANLNDPLLQ